MSFVEWISEDTDWREKYNYKYLTQTNNEVGALPHKNNDFSKYTEANGEKSNEISAASVRRTSELRYIYYIEWWNTRMFADRKRFADQSGSLPIFIRISLKISTKKIYRKLQAI